MNQLEFRSELDRLMAAFAVQLKAEQIDGYWQTLRDLPAEGLRTAVNEILSGGSGEEWQKIPPPAVLYRIMRRYTPERAGQPQGLSPEAFEMRRRLIEERIQKLKAKPIITARMKVDIERLEHMLLNDYRWEEPIDAKT